MLIVDQMSSRISHGTSKYCNKSKVVKEHIFAIKQTICKNIDQLAGQFSLNDLRKSGNSCVSVKNKKLLGLRTINMTHEEALVLKDQSTTFQVPFLFN